MNKLKWVTLVSAATVTVVVGAVVDSVIGPTRRTIMRFCSNCGRDLIFDRTNPEGDLTCRGCSLAPDDCPCEGSPLEGTNDKFLVTPS